MKNFLKQNSIYLLVYLVTLLYVGNILLNNGKVQIHKAINAHVGNEFLDSIFKYATHLGDGLFAFGVAFVLAFVSIRKSMYVLLSYFGAALFSTIMKHWLFTEIYRPHFVFQYFVREELKEVEGVDMLGLNSFPSGHALSAFALFVCLLFMTKNHLLKFLFLFLAFLAAFSRTYLSQHWLVDIYVGSIIGTLFSILFYIVFYNRVSSQRFDTTLPKLLSKK